MKEKMMDKLMAYLLVSYSEKLMVMKLDLGWDP